MKDDKYEIVYNTDKIKEYMEENDYNTTTFAKYCAIDERKIWKILNNKSVSLYYLVRISKVTKINYEDLFIY